MSIYVKPCAKHRRARKAAQKPASGTTARRKAKDCPDCRWIAVTTPEHGRKSLGTFDTRAEAEKAEREHLTARENGSFIERSTTTLDAVVQRFLESRRLKGLSEVSLHTYKRLWELRAKSALGGLPVQQLTGATLTSHYDTLLGSGNRHGKPLARKTVRDLQGFVHSVLSYAVRSEIIARNVADVGERITAEKREAGIHQRADVEALFKAAEGDRLELLPRFALATGLRRGELAALKWANVDLERKSIAVVESIAEVGGKTWTKRPKSNEVRLVSLADLTIADLRRHSARQAAEKIRAGGVYDDQDFVFAPEHGGGYNPNALYKCHARIATRAKVTTSLHRMRHSFGSWLIRQGVDIVTVSKLLGHSDITTTMRIYAHELEGSKRAAADSMNVALASLGKR